MNWFKQLSSRRRLYDDLSEEIQQHLQEKIEELVASVMSRKEAAAAARREFGNVTLMEEDSRAIWGWPSIESFFGDLRYGAGNMLRTPGFTTITVLTLALGIGAAAAIFSAVNPILFESLPYPHAGRISMCGDCEPEGAPTNVQFHTYRELAPRSRPFDAIAVMKLWQPTLVGTKG